MFVSVRDWRRVAFCASTDCSCLFLIAFHEGSSFYGFGRWPWCADGLRQLDGAFRLGLNGSRAHLCLGKNLQNPRC